MPNWCNNTLEVSHEDPAKLKAFVDAVNEGKMCNFAIPVPESLHIVAGRVGDDTDPKQIELVEQEKANREAHGYATWYDFCVSRWGTKWDVEPYDTVEFDPEGVTFGFDSAWSPPCGVYEALVEQGFSVRAMYYEPGMAFAGIWEDGDDEFYEYGGMNSKQIAEELPAVLDEAFNISEDAAMWEEENKEEEAE